MSAVSNQQSYVEIKPLPLPNEGFPRLHKLFARTALSIAITGACITLGFGASLSNLNISIFAGTVCGGIVGIIASIALSILMHIPSKLSQYRLDTLKQIEGASKNPEVLKAIKELENFFYYPLLSFSQMFQHHYLQYTFTTISARLDREMKDACKVWAEFLKGLHKTKVTNPDGTIIELDMGLQLERLQGKSVSVKIEPLNSNWSGTNQKDLEEIEKLQKLCFGKSEIFSKAQMENLLKNNKGKCLLARREGTGDILGYILSYEKEGAVQIAGLGRHPGATHLNIGGQLICALISQLKSSQAVQVCLRQSNPAARIFGKYRFVKEKDLPKYYLQGPAEDGILLNLDWKKYNQFMSQ
ncbi:MAG: hypothetical protein K1000chlam2_00479 [Chlamydiae bacterium]|nr:hypothetical protein [Chlamydiota bacterium]